MEIRVKNVFLLILLFFIVRLFFYDIVVFQITSILNSGLPPGLRGYISRLLRYLGRDTSVNITTGFLRRLVLVGLFLFLYGKSKIKNVYFNIYLLGFFVYILFMGNPVMASRTSLSFEFFMCPMFASVIKPRVMTWKAWCITGITLFILLLLLITVLQKGNAIPYQSYIGFVQ
jgi:hypothetical protein